MLRDQDAQDYRQPRRCPHLNQLCRANDLTDADGYEALYEIDECPLQEVKNHRHALSLYFMHDNVARIHSTLRVTPAMQADIADHVWSMEEIEELLS